MKNTGTSVLLVVAVIGILSLVFLFAQAGLTGQSSSSGFVMRELDAHKKDYSKMVKELDTTITQMIPETKGGRGGWKGGSYIPPTQYTLVKPKEMLTAMNKYLDKYKEYKPKFLEYLQFLEANRDVLVSGGVNVLELKTDVNDAIILYDSNIGLMRQNAIELEQQYELNDAEKELLRQFWEKMQGV